VRSKASDIRGDETERKEEAKNTASYKTEDRCSHKTLLHTCITQKPTVMYLYFGQTWALGLLAEHDQCNHIKSFLETRNCAEFLFGEKE
jgi:hypothetical protein